MPEVIVSFEENATATPPLSTMHDLVVHEEEELNFCPK